MVGTDRRRSYQSRVHWWRAQFQRQREGSLSVAEFCRRLGVSVATFYYWRNRVHEVPPNASGQVPGEHLARRTTPAAGNTSAAFVPVSILEPAVGAALEIELTNACVVRFKGAIDPDLLQVAITAVGQLNGSRQGAD
jgi:Transposase